MKFKNTKRIIAGAASVLCAVMLMTGCSVKFGTAPKDNDVVAKPKNGGTPEMSILYGEFKSQYLFFLKQNEIEDDTSAEHAAACKAQRADIIDNLICDKIYLKKAEEYGVLELSEDEKKTAEETFSDQIDQMVKYYGKKVLGIKDDTNDTSDTSNTESGSAYSEEEIISKGNEELDKVLAECCMTRDDLRTWLDNFIIATHVLDKAVESVTREDAKAEYDDFIKELEELYKSNNSYIYYQYEYYNYWLPEGSRLIKHVLLGFGEETQQKITDLRKEGKENEANALRGEKAAELTDKIAEVNQKLDDNVDFNTILLNYSADAAGSSAYPDGYLVLPDDPRWVSEFTEAAFVPEKIGDRTLCTSDYGVHIMIYAGDAEIDDEVVEQAISTIYGNLRTETANTITDTWLSEYDYTIDYEKLRIDPASTAS